MNFSIKNKLFFIDFFRCWNSFFFDKGMRGGFSDISKRYSKADNKYLKSYDRKPESKQIIYLTENNLCGYVMSRFLQTIGFKWIDSKEFNLNKYNKNSPKDCVLKIGLEYPKELGKLHYDYPLAPESNVVRMSSINC